MGVKIHKSKMPPNKNATKKHRNSRLPHILRRRRLFWQCDLAVSKTFAFAITVNGNNNGRNNSES